MLRPASAPEGAIEVNSPSLGTWVPLVGLRGQGLDAASRGDDRSLAKVEIGDGLASIVYPGVSRGVCWGFAIGLSPLLSAHHAEILFGDGTMLPTPVRGDDAAVHCAAGAASVGVRFATR